MKTSFVEKLLERAGRVGPEEMQAQLARLAEVYMLELGKDVCVNVYKPEELKRGFAMGLYENDSRIKDIEKYNKMKEKELESMGLDVDEYRRVRMVEIRGLKDELYEKMVRF